MIRYQCRPGGDFLILWNMSGFRKLYQELKKKYGKPSGQWKLWCKRPRPKGARLAQRSWAAKTKKEKEEVIIGAILTQRTNWKNVEIAIGNLKRARLDSLKSIYRLGAKKLAFLIKPSGFYQVKARCLFSLAKFIIENYGSLEKMKKKKEEELRKELLKLKGVGPETADSILLYALDKPIFVVDEYTRRLIKKRKLSQNFSYEILQKLFEKNLKKDFRLYQDFHALIVIDGKNK